MAVNDHESTFADWVAAQGITPTASSTIEITRWPSLIETRGQRSALTWRALVGELSKPAPRPANAEKPDLPGWSPAKFREDRRAKGGALEVTALVIDVDEGALPLDRVREAFAGFRAVVHCTKSSRPSAPCWRIVVALSRPTRLLSKTEHEHDLLWRWMRDRLAPLGIVVDEQTKDAGRLWYVPCEPVEGDYVCISLDGHPLDVDAALAERREQPPTSRIDAPAESAPRTRTDLGSEPEELSRISMATRKRRAAKYLEQAEPAISGERGHDVAMRVATATVRGFALDDAAAHEVLASWNTRCEPPWSAAELSHKIREAANVGAMTWGKMLLADDTRAREQQTAKTSAAANDTTSDAWSSRLVVVPGEWYSSTPPARTWLLRDSRRSGASGVLPLGKAGELIAEGGAGKTMALVQLALAVATGTRWLGTFDVVSPGRVLAVLGEEDEEEARRRIFRALRASGAPKPEPGMLVTLPLAGVPSEMIRRDGDGNPVEAPFLRWLRSCLAQHDDWRLIVIDPLSRFAGLDAEKDNAQATRFVEAVESLVVQTNATALVAHHTAQHGRGQGAKLTATSARGVTALGDGFRWQGALAVEHVDGLESEAAERLGELVTFTYTKSNYSAKWAPVVLRRDLTNGSALVPLDDGDVSMLADVRKSSDQAARRSRERDVQREERRCREAEERAQRIAETASRDAERVAAEDAALVAILRERPGIGTVELRAEMVARLGTCSHDRAAAAVIRLRSAVRVEPGPKNGKRHFLVEEASVPRECV